MNDTRRTLLILGILVREPHGMTVYEIREALPKAYRTHVRSLQRDLVALKRWTQLKVDRHQKPYVWFYPRTAWCPCCDGPLHLQPLNND